MADYSAAFSGETFSTLRCLTSFIAVRAGLCWASTLGVLGEPQAEVILGEPTQVFDVGAIEGLPYARAQLAVSDRTSLPVRLVAWGRDGEIAERFVWSRTEVDPALDEAVDFDLAY
jgi:hypothetical protein